jgi:hypothetical protein
MNHFLLALDSLDACIFTGDSLEDPANRQELRTNLDRWTRALVEREARAASEAVEGQSTPFKPCSTCRDPARCNTRGCKHEAVPVLQTEGLAISNPICPHCKLPVLFEHLSTAVMVVAMGSRIVAGPYHGECGVAIARGQA